MHAWRTLPRRRAADGLSTGLLEIPGQLTPPFDRFELGVARYPLDAEIAMGAGGGRTEIWRVSEALETERGEVDW